MGTSAAEAVIDTPPTDTTPPVTEAPATDTPSADATTDRPRGPDGKFLPKDAVAIDTPTTPDTSSTPEVPAAPAVPERYQLQLPTDSPLPVASIERTAAIARELGLDNGAAQKVLDSFNASLVDAIAAERAEHEAQVQREQQEWKATALKDPEIGGTPDKLTVSEQKAQQVVKKFGGEEITTFLKDSGLEKHPMVIRMLSRIGKAMSEGSLVLGTAEVVPPRQPGVLPYENNGEGPKRDPQAA